MATEEERIAASILGLLRERNPNDRPGEKSICPSEAVRRVDPEGWRGKMDACREVAARLADDGLVEICQRGEPVDPETARGPIRIRLAGGSQ